MYFIDLCITFLFWGKIRQVKPLTKKRFRNEDMNVKKNETKKEKKDKNIETKGKEKNSKMSQKRKWQNVAEKKRNDRSIDVPMDVTEAEVDREDQKRGVQRHVHPETPVDGGTAQMTVVVQEVGVIVSDPEGDKETTENAPIVVDPDEEDHPPAPAPQDGRGQVHLLKAGRPLTSAFRRWTPSRAHTERQVYIYNIF